MCDSFSNNYRKSNVKRHVKEKHLVEKHLEGISLTCHLCGELFRSRKELEYHKRNPMDAHRSKYHKRKFEKFTKLDATVQGQSPQTGSNAAESETIVDAVNVKNDNDSVDLELE